MADNAKGVRRTNEGAGHVPDTVVLDVGKVGGYRVRVIQADAHDPRMVVLDIRQYVESNEFTGFTKRGVRLRPALVLELMELLARPEVCAALGSVAFERCTHGKLKGL